MRTSLSRLKSAVRTRMEQREEVPQSDDEIDDDADADLEAGNARAMDADPSTELLDALTVGDAERVWTILSESEEGPDLVHDGACGYAHPSTGACRAPHAGV